MTKIHGMDGTSEYRTWVDMRRRCHQPQRPDYRNYGARGIYVCDQWRFGDGQLTGFQVFFRDMGPRPSPEHTIDRIDNDGPYSPENCQWAMGKRQDRNRRTNHLVTLNGETITLKEAAERVGINYYTLFSRYMTRGWSFEDSIAAPILARGFTLTGRRLRKNASAR